MKPLGGLGCTIPVVQLKGAGSSDEKGVPSGGCPIDAVGFFVTHSLSHEPHVFQGYCLILCLLSEQ